MTELNENTAQEAGRQYWSWVCEYLDAELRCIEDPQRKIQFTLGLFRVLYDRLERHRDALSLIDGVMGDAPDSPDVVWEALRASSGRDSRTRASVLELLARLLELPEDRAACLLDIAAILEMHLEDPEGAVEKRSEASQVAPDSRGVLWCSLVQALADDDTPVILESLTRLEEATGDGIWGATLLAERIALLRDGGAEGWEVQDLLDRLLNRDALDWPLVNEALATSEALGLWEIHARALKILADRALTPLPEAVEGRPDGYAYDGFERGQPAAAGQLWLLSLVRERKLGDREAALAAIDEALGILPDDPFLRMERSRLLESLLRYSEALEGLPDEAPASWKAELCLASGSAHLVADFVRAAKLEVDSKENEILMEVASGQDASRDEEGPSVVSAGWLASNPGHPDALSVARGLEESGSGDHLTRLVIRDAIGADADWPTEEDLAGEGAWKIAARVVSGKADDLGKALLEWSGLTESQVAKAALMEAAAEVFEREGDLEGALAILEKKAQEHGSCPAVDAGMTRILRRMLRWRDLSEHLERTAAEAEGKDDRLVARALRALVQEYALSRPADASGQVEELGSELADDVVQVWTGVRLAVRQGNWDVVVEGLDQLIGLCPEDGPGLGLLASEVDLFAAQRLEEAVTRLGPLAECDVPDVAFAARVYLSDAYHRTGDLESLGRLLEREMNSGEMARREIWLAEILEAGRSVFGNEAVSDLLGMFSVDGPVRMLWDLLLETATASRGGVGPALLRLAKNPEAERMAPRCRLAAAMVDSEDPARLPKLEPGDLDDEEVVWHVADRLSPDADPEIRLAVYSARTKLCPEASDERVDWILCCAEAMEDSGDRAGALKVVLETLDDHPEHPGLLEALARLSVELGEFVAAADAHGRLAGYYASQEAKATQLAKAARIMFEHLDDLEGAQNVVQEAIRRSPSHEESHEVLTDILRTRGDEDALARQIEERIDAQEGQAGISDDDEALIELYEEQVDRLYAVDDLAGALEAVDKMLFVSPERLSAHRTKIDLLMGMGRWEDAVDSMFEFNFACDDQVEIRTMTWQAAGVLAEEMGDPGRAISELLEMVNGGDEHPQTERQIANIATAAGLWEEAAAALGRLAPQVKERDKRSDILREQAQILIEHVYDTDAAEEVLQEALILEPGNIKAVKLVLEFSDDEDRASRLDRAMDSLRKKAVEGPISPTVVTGMTEVARLRKRDEERELYASMSSVLLGDKNPDAPSIKLPRGQVTAELSELILHADDAGPPAEVILASREMMKDAFGAAEGFPPFGKSTLVHRKSEDPVRVWLAAWASFLGVEKFELHRTGHDPRGSQPLPGEIPSVAVNPDILDITAPEHVFFLARSLWRATRGLSGFEEGDAAMPVRWIMALTAAVLGDDAGLPLPTDRDLVDRAAKVMPRRVRKRLAEPCQALLKVDPLAIRAWVQATSYSADRFGLLACSCPAAAVPLVVEEAAGPMGIRKLEENPVSTLSKVPRCVQLFKFVLSGQYLQLSDAVYDERRGE